MKYFKKLTDKIYDDKIDLKKRLLTVILLCVIAGAVVGLIPMFFGISRGWWLNLIIMTTAIISQIINVKFNKRDLSTFFMAIAGIFFILPTMYFQQGGLASGMPFWLVFATMTAFIMLNGWKRYISVASAIIMFSLCFATEYHFPNTVVYLPNRTTIFIDVFISFLSTTIIYLIMLGIYLEAYAKKREKLDYALHYDALTGIENRYAYENYINELSKTPMANNLIMVSGDVNSLKIINDTQGHAAGDELLKGAAKVFSDSFGSYGKVFRTGGDEFQATIFTDKDISEIQRDFEENMRRWTGDLVKELHISVGYACSKLCDTNSYPTLSKTADKEMYKDKASYYKANGINRRTM